MGRNKRNKRNKGTDPRDGTLRKPDHLRTHPARKKAQGPFHPKYIPHACLTSPAPGRSNFPPSERRLGIVRIQVAFPLDHTMIPVPITLPSRRSPPCSHVVNIHCTAPTAPGLQRLRWALAACGAERLKRAL